MPDAKAFHTEVAGELVSGLRHFKTIGNATAAQLALLGAALVFDRAAQFRGAVKLIPYQSRGGVCKRCQRHFFNRSARGCGEIGYVKHCSFTCRNRENVSSTEARKRQERKRQINR